MRSLASFISIATIVCLFSTFIASAARAPDCNGDTFSTLQEITLLGTDQNYELRLSCVYNGGLNFKGTIAVLRGVKIYIDSSIIKGRLSFVGHTLDDSSAFVVTRTTMTAMTTIDLLQNLGEGGYIEVSDNTIQFKNTASTVGLLITPATGFTFTAGSRGVLVARNTMRVIDTIIAFPMINIFPLTAGRVLPVNVTDNNLFCYSTCIYLRGQPYAIVERNTFASSRNLEYTALQATLSQGTITSYANNNHQNFFIFLLTMAAAPLRNGTFLNLTEAVMRTFTVTTAVVQTGAIVMDLTNAVVQGITTFDLKTVGDVRLNFYEFQSTADTNINIDAPNAGPLRMSTSVFTNVILTTNVLAALTIQSCEFTQLTIQSSSANITLFSNSISSTTATTLIMLTANRKANTTINIQKNILVIARAAALRAVVVVANGAFDGSAIISDNYIDNAGTVATTSAAVYIDTATRLSVTIVRNEIFAPIGFAVYLSMAGSRHYIDETNKITGACGYYIVHTTLPLPFTYFSLKGFSGTDVTFNIPATGISSNMTLSFDDIVLTGSLLISISSAVEPKLYFNEIRATGIGSFSAKSDFLLTESAFTRLDFTITAPKATILSGVVVTDVSATPATWTIFSPLFSVTKCDISSTVINALVRVVVSANTNVEVSDNKFPTLFLTVTQAIANSTFVVDRNAFDTAGYSFDGGLEALLIDWRRTGTGGNASLRVADNGLSLNEGGALKRGLRLISTLAATTTQPAMIDILRNSINSLDGWAAHIAVRNAVLTSQGNDYLSTSLTYSVTMLLTDCLLIHDETNNFLSEASGGVTITHDTPRAFQVFKIVQMQMAFFEYKFPTAAAPTNATIVISGLTLTGYLRLTLGAAINPQLTLTGVSAGALSSIQMKTADLEHSYCTYAGLNLDIQSPNFVYMHHLKTIRIATTNALTWAITTGNFTLANSVIDALTFTPTITARESLSLLDNNLPATSLTVTQNVPNASLIIERNIINTATPIYQSRSSANEAFGIAWTRTGTGNATFRLVGNTISIDATAAGNIGVYITSTTVAPTTQPAIATISDNYIDALEGRAMYMTLRNADVTMQRNIFLSTSAVYAFGGSYAVARVTFDETNSFPVELSGGLSIVHTEAPRAFQVLRVAGAQISFLTYTLPTAAAPTNATISITDVTLTGSLTLALGAAVSPVLTMYAVSAAALSSIQMKTADFEHAYCTYAGLNLDIQSPNYVYMHHLKSTRAGTGALSWIITTGNFTLANSVIDALTFTPTITARESLSLLDNNLPATSLTVTQNVPNASLIIERNIINTAAPIPQSRSGMSETLGIAWTRTGTGNATFRMVGNTISIDTSGTGNVGVYITSTTVAPTTQPAIATISDNFIDVIDGRAMYMVLRNADVTLQRNVLLSTSAVFAFSGSFAVARVTFDETNSFLPELSGGISIDHTEAPRAFQVFKVMSLQTSYVTYNLPAAAAPTNATIRITDVTLSGALTLKLGAAVLPMVTMYGISASALSTIQMKTVDFEHSYCTYAGLNLDIQSPNYVYMHHLKAIRTGTGTGTWTVTTGNFTLASSVIDAVSFSPTITARETFALIDNNLPATSLTITQNVPNASLIIERNIINTATPIYQTRSSANEALGISWTRTGTGNATFRMVGNTISIETTSESNIGVYITSSAVASTTQPAIATISDNYIETIAGRAMCMILRNADVTIVRNFFLSSSTQYAFGGSFAVARVTFDESNSFLTELSGGLSIVHTEAPRAFQVFKVKGLQISFLTYTLLPAATAPTNATIAITDVTLVNSLSLTLAAASLPAVTMSGISAGGLSTIQMKTVDFEHAYCTYAGLNLDIQSPNSVYMHHLKAIRTGAGNLGWTIITKNFTLTDSEISAESFYNYITSQYYYLLNNNLPATSLFITQNVANASMIIERNVINTAIPRFQARSNSNEALGIAWTRTAVGGNATFRLVSNTISIDSNSEDNIGVYVTSYTVAPTTQPAIALITDNYIETQTGRAMQLLIRNADITMQRNSLLSSSTQYAMSGNFQVTRFAFDETNIFLTELSGGISILHTEAPRASQLFKVVGRQLAFIEYTHPPAVNSKPPNATIIITNVLLIRNISLALWYAYQPIVQITGLTATILSGIQMKNANFDHGNSNYPRGLVLDVVAPSYINMYGLDIECPSSVCSWYMNSSTIDIFDMKMGGTGRWTVMTAGAAVMRDSKLPGIYMNFVYLGRNASFSYLRNMITEGIYEGDTNLRSGLAFTADRNILGAICALNIIDNSFLFNGASTYNRPIVLRGSGTMANSRLYVNISGNTLNSINGGAIAADAANIDVTISRNMMISSTAGSVVDMAIDSSRCVYTDDNFVTVTAGISIRHSGKPLDGSKLDIHDATLRHLEYTMPKVNNVARGTSIKVSSMVLLNFLNIQSGTSIEPYFNVTDIISNGASVSTIQAVVASMFVNSFNWFAGPLVYDIVSAQHIHINNIYTGAYCRWTLVADSDILINDNFITDTRFTITLTAILTGYSRLMILRNKFMYPPSNVGVTRYPLRITFTRPTKIPTNSTYIDISDNTFAFTQASGYNFAFELYPISAANNLISPVVAFIYNNTFDGMGGVAYRLELGNADITTQWNRFVTGNIYNVLASSRITFDNSNYIRAGGLLFTVSNPKPNNVVMLTNGNVIFFSYIVSVGTAFCDRLILLDTLITAGYLTIQYQLMVKSDISILRLSQKAESAGRIIVKGTHLIDSSIRIARCSLYGGIDLTGYTGTNNSLISVTDNNVENDLYALIGGNSSFVEIRGNRFTTNRLYPAMTLTLQLAGSPTIIIASNRLEYGFGFSAQRPITMNSYTYSLGPALQYTNVKVIIANNSFYGSELFLGMAFGNYTVYNNYFNPGKIITWLLGNYGSVYATEDSNNRFYLSDWRVTVIALVTRFNFELRDITLTALSINTVAAAATIRNNIRLHRVQANFVTIYVGGANDTELYVTDSTFTSDTTASAMGWPAAGFTKGVTAILVVSGNTFTRGVAIDYRGTARSLGYSNTSVAVIERNVIYAYALALIYLRSPMPTSFKNNTVYLMITGSFVFFGGSDGYAADIYNNTFNTTVAAVTLEFQFIFVNVTYGGVSVAHNTFQLTTRLSITAASTRRLELVRNRFLSGGINIVTDTSTAQQMYGNIFNQIITGTRVATAMLYPNPFRSGCNTNLTGLPYNYTTFEVRNVETPCLATNNVTLCFGIGAQATPINSATFPPCQAQPQIVDNFVSIAELARSAILTTANAALALPIAVNGSLTCERNPYFNWNATRTETLDSPVDLTTRPPLVIETMTTQAVPDDYTPPTFNNDTIDVNATDPVEETDPETNETIFDENATTTTPTSTTTKTTTTTTKPTTSTTTVTTSTTTTTSTSTLPTSTTTTTPTTTETETSSTSTSESQAVDTSTSQPATTTSTTLSSTMFSSAPTTTEAATGPTSTSILTQTATTTTQEPTSISTSSAPALTTSTQLQTTLASVTATSTVASAAPATSTTPATSATAHATSTTSSTAETGTAAPMATTSFSAQSTTLASLTSGTPSPLTTSTEATSIPISSSSATTTAMVVGASTQQTSTSTTPEVTSTSTSTTPAVTSTAPEVTSTSTTPAVTSTSTSTTPAVTSTAPIAATTTGIAPSSSAPIQATTSSTDTSSASVDITTGQSTLTGQATTSILGTSSSSPSSDPTTTATATDTETQPLSSSVSDMNLTTAAQSETFTTFSTSSVVQPVTSSEPLTSVLTVPSSLLTSYIDDVATTTTRFTQTTTSIPSCFVHFLPGHATIRSEAIQATPQTIMFVLPTSNFTIDPSFELKWSASNTGKPEPRGFVALVAEATTCTIGLYSITCNLPSRSNYSIETSESAVLHINANAIQPRVAGCNPNYMLTVGVLTVQLSSESGNSVKGSWASSSSFASSAASAAVLIISDGTSIEVQSMAVMLLGVCSDDSESVRFVKYFLSPFISINTQWAVIGNFLLAMVVLLAHWLIVVVNSVSSPGDSMLEVGARLWFPSFPLAVASILYMGVISSTFELFHSASGGTDYFAIALGIIYLITVPACCLWAVLRIRPSYQPHSEYQSRGAPATWALPRGYYYPEGPRRASMWVFGFAEHSCRWFAFLPHVVTIVVSVLVSALPSSVDCTVKYVILCIAFAVAAIVVAVLRPYRALMTSALTVLAFVSLCLLCLAQLVALNSSEDTARGAGRLKDGAIILVIIFVTVRMVHTLMVILIEVAPEQGPAEEKYAEVDETDAFFVEKGLPDVEGKQEVWAAVGKEDSTSSDAAQQATGENSLPKEHTELNNMAVACQPVGDDVKPYSPSTTPQGVVLAPPATFDSPAAADMAAEVADDPYATSSDDGEDAKINAHGVDVHALPRPKEANAPSALDAYTKLITNAHKAKSHASPSSSNSEDDLY